LQHNLLHHIFKTLFLLYFVQKVLMSLFLVLRARVSWNQTTTSHIINFERM